MAHKNKSNISPYKTRLENKGRKVGGQSGRHRAPERIYHPSEASDRLRDIFFNHEYGHITHLQREQLAQFYFLLMNKQKSENFTRLLKIRDIAIKHFIDSWIVSDLVELKFPLLDVGTGPGFPGIPLKIKHPDQSIFLAEGVQRRVEFLKEVRDELQLQNLGIFGRNVNPYFAYPVQGVITRAVEDLRNTLANVSTCLQTGGHVYFMKGPHVDPEIELAKKEWGEYYELIQDIQYTLPKTDNHRRLLVYKKIKSCPLPDFDEEPWPGEEL